MSKKRKYCINCFIILGAEQETCFSCKHTQNVPDNSIFLRPPFRLNNQYFLGRVLGQGGFAITYLAYDRNLRTRVAIKEYLPIEFSTRSSDGINVIPHFGESKELFLLGKEKFIAEARLLANFRSPNIITIRQFFEANDTGYFVMEYLDGLTLTEFIKQEGGKLGIKKSREILMPLLDALEEVHFMNTFHRDIKPDNIYMTQKGEPILLDFGAARQSMSGATTNLLAFLTPGFSPLEQYSANGIQGPWTDIYALGATLYFMLTGIVPSNPQDRIMEEDNLKPPSQLGSDIPPEDEEWLLKALEIKWSQRPDSIQAWRSLIYKNSLIVQPGEASDGNLTEDNFIKIAILPKLADHILTKANEEEIIASAVFMEIPLLRVMDLIEEALTETESTRETESSRQEAELEEQKAEREAEERQASLRQQEEDIEHLKAEEIQHLEEIERKEEALRRASEEAIRAEEKRFNAEEERLKKEIELKRKEKELKQWEEELKLKAEQNVKDTQVEPQLSDTQANKIEKTILVEKEEQDVVEIEDISEEELEELLGAMSANHQPRNKSKKEKRAKDKGSVAPEPPGKAPQSSSTPKPLTVDEHYAQIAANVSSISIASKRLFDSNKTLAETLINDLNMNFVLVSPIIFGEGFTLIQPYAIGPKEQETLLKKPFYIQTTPVTQVQWEAVMKNNPAHFSKDTTCPVEQVSWDDCQLFIHLLNMRQEAKYRLPKEVEWEFACRADAKTVFSFGDDAVRLDEYEWYKANSEQKTHPVAQKKHNKWGLYDLQGNVREWLQDKYKCWPEDEFQPKDLKGARVVRGGAWDYPSSRCKIQYRGGERPSQRTKNLGFRLVIEAS